VKHWADQFELLRRTAVVVPAYFGPQPSDQLVRRLLWITLAECHHYLPPENVWVVVDGDARTARLARELQHRLEGERGSAFHLVALPENGGKLRAIREGVMCLLPEDPLVRFVAIRDGDGDHAIADLPNLVRTADELARICNNDNVLIAGARSSRHHPMGWVRGELEILLDGLTLDALAYHLAHEGRALDLTHSLVDAAVPDISSGYKVYSRALAEELFVRRSPQYTCLDETAYWRYGPETITFVEAMLLGAAFGEARRATFDGQPASSFGDFAHVELYGDLLAWVYCRLDLPVQVAAQLYDNRAVGLALRTTAAGQETMEGVRQRSLEALASYRGRGEPIPMPSERFSFI